MRTRLIAVLVLLAIAAAACGNSPSTTSDTPGKTGSESAGGQSERTTTSVNPEELTKNIPSNQPGVTDTEIRVGGVVSKTNALNLPLDQAFQGAKAYFAMINDQGGIYGRKLVLAAERDDRMVNNTSEIEALISQDKVFAILPVATLLFTGSAVAEERGIPTFGWNINAQWEGPPNLFGEKGHVCINCAYPTQP
ncbi:MAG: ABC transporter substrate-binding protein, partial [Acidimicrobiales bacterium]|nr:ABC transporter substrate-binding protein [Acidimicrobiales bacterium]